MVTGVSPSSIGYSIALEIASQRPAILIIASRTASKLDAVAHEISKYYHLVRVEKVILDLACIESVKLAASQINRYTEQIDVLINNAGVSLSHRDPITTPDGSTVDLQFLINHLGPFLLTELLLPKILTAGARSAKGETRIVNLSSHGHRLSPIRFSDYQFSRGIFDSVPEDERPSSKAAEGFLRTIDGYPGFLGYAQSKTANILHSLEMSKLFQAKQTGIIALSVHPGSIQTELSRSLDEVGKKMIEGTAPGGAWKTIDQGAATALVAAFDPRLAEVDVGVSVCGYMSDCQLADHLAAPWAKDHISAARLWQESERMLGITSVLKSYEPSKRSDISQ